MALTNNGAGVAAWPDANPTALELALRKPAYGGPTIRFWNNSQTYNGTSTCPWAHRAWIALEEKQLPYEFKTVDLGNKPEQFQTIYASIMPDVNARAKVPILELGSTGSPDYVKLTESDVVTRYIAAQWPERGNTELAPQDPLRAAKANLFVEVFMSALANSSFTLLAAHTDAALKKEVEKMLVGLIALERALEMHGEGSGPFLLGKDFSLAECLTASFAVRALANFEFHRGAGVEAACERLGLTRALHWFSAVRDRPSVTATTPEVNSLRQVPPYLRARFYERKLSGKEFEAICDAVAKGLVLKKDAGPQGAMGETEFQQLIREGVKAAKEDKKRRAKL